MKIWFQGVTFSTQSETEIINAVHENRRLLKVSINLRLPEGRHKIENAMIRNSEIRKFYLLILWVQCTYFSNCIRQRESLYQMNKSKGSSLILRKKEEKMCSGKLFEKTSESFR